MTRLARGWVAVAVVAFAIGGAVWVGGRGGEPPPAVRARLSVAEALGGDAAGFARALTPRPFVFPDDHGPHEGFRTEWWYYTGNLATAAGRRFGFQVTFFRRALGPQVVPRPSAWGAAQVYLAHFAVSDVAAGRFHAAERVRRGALGLAGATGRPFRVWLDGWSVEGTGPGAFPARLRARDGATALDLVLDSAKPPALHGERGLSRKSAEPGNASYYYSLTRMPAQGTLEVAEGRHEVAGSAWMDREWSTSALGADQVGWDWFALQLDDGRELMLYRLRRRDGTADPASGGTLVGPDGRTETLAAADAPVDVLGWWTSPRGAARYPARWRLRVPGHGLDLEIAPRLADQELDLAVRYWEGAVAVRGRAGDAAVTGQGYVELTGYAGAAPRSSR